jgi:hypothetical protein
MTASGVSHAVCPLSKTALVVIPAKAGIQNSSEFQDFGSTPAFAGVGRNDVRIITRT